MTNNEVTITFRQVETVKTWVPVSKELYSERTEESAETVIRPYIEALAEATAHKEYPDVKLRITHGPTTWHERAQDDYFTPLEHPQYYAVLHSKIYQAE
jgi:hypothetical protein